MGRSRSPIPSCRSSDGRNHASLMTTTYSRWRLPAGVNGPTGIRFRSSSTNNQNTLSLGSTDVRCANVSLHEGLRLTCDFVEMRTEHGFAADVVWLRDHIWADEVAYNYFYRELYEQYAQKYPDISIQDWDVLITHMANTAYTQADSRFIVSCTQPCPHSCRILCICGQDSASPMLVPAVFSAPMAMFARWKQIRFLTPLLNGLQRMSFYLWTAAIAMQPYRHWAYPLTLQNKQRVAEMLREAYPGLEDEAQQLRMKYREC